MRVVPDTNILVRANPNTSPQGLARELLLAVLSGPHVLIVSSAILTGIERVLNYPRVQARWPLTAEAIAAYRFFLQDIGAMVDLPASFPAIVRDPDDDLVLQTAIAGRADVLCTRDEHFRDEAVERVCAAHGIRIIGDIALMQELRGRSL